MVGVAGLEPAASWSRRFGWKFNGRFEAHLVLFVPGVVAFQTSPLQCLHPLLPWSGSAFGSNHPTHHLMGAPLLTRWWGMYEQDESEQ